MKLYPKISSEAVYDELGHCMFRVRVENSNGSAIEKTLSLDAYMKILGDSSLSQNSKFFTIGALPKGYVNAKISDRSDTFKVMLFYKAEKRAFSLCGAHYFIPFPALVFVFSCNQGVLQQRFCCATAAEILTPDTPLMMYPFGNVSTSGDICFGNVENARISALNEVDQIVENFFMSVTNNDYFADKYPFPQEVLVEKIVGKDMFPVELLKPDPQKRNINDIF